MTKTNIHIHTLYGDTVQGISLNEAINLFFKNSPII